MANIRELWCAALHFSSQFETRDGKGLTCAICNKDLDRKFAGAVRVGFVAALTGIVVSGWVVFFSWLFA